MSSITYRSVPTAMRKCLSGKRRLEIKHQSVFLIKCEINSTTPQLKSYEGKYVYGFF